MVRSRCDGAFGWETKSAMRRSVGHVSATYEATYRFRRGKRDSGPRKGGTTPLTEYESRSLGSDVKPETRIRPLTGGRRRTTVQRWSVAVATAVPSDWPKKMMLEGATARERGGGEEEGPGPGPGPLDCWGGKPVRKE